jgi:hypothetical protein
MFSDADPVAALAPAPPALRDAATGFPAFGRYLGLIRDLTTATWDGSLGVTSARRTQRKTWVFLGAFSPRFMAGFAIVDAGLLSTAFVYLYDRETRTLLEDKTTMPLGFGRAFEGRLDQSWELDCGNRRWRIATQGKGWVAEFVSSRWRLRLTATQSGPGMSTVASSPDRPFNFTYKDCDLEVQLQATAAGVTHDVAARGMVDFTLGYPPRRTFWNWAAASGTAGGHRAGFNLVAHFNNGLENALWLDGRIVPLAQASFIYDASALDKPWRVVSADGALDLVFEPEGRRAENVNALVLGSRFVQLFGRFSGTLRIDGRAHDYAGFGVVEEHRALW